MSAGVRIDAQAEMQVAEQFDSAVQQHQAATFGVWIFLATELMFFGPLFLGYVYGRMHFSEAFGAASRHTDIALGTLNTALLLTSSATMAAATVARKVSARVAVWLLLATALLGIGFLVVKGMEYHKEWDEALFPGARFSFEAAYADGAQMFFFLYFALTGLHALHLFIGVTLTLFFTFNLRRGRTLFANEEKHEILALYWHFVDLVWIFLYPMLYLIQRGGG